MAIVYEQNFEGSIWKVVNGSGPFVGIEERDEDVLEVKFHKLMLESLHMSPIDHPDFDWWFSLIGVDEINSYFRKFESEKDPFRQDLLSLNDAKSLTPVSNTDVNENDGRFLNSTIYGVGDASWGTIAQFLKKWETIPVKSIEYAESSNFFVLVYCEQVQDRLSRQLMIVSNSGSLLYKCILDQETKGEASQGFITFSNLVIFVEERKKLRIFEV